MNNSKITAQYNYYPFGKQKVYFSPSGEVGTERALKDLEFWTVERK